MDHRINKIPISTKNQFPNKMESYAPEDRNWDKVQSTLCNDQTRSKISALRDNRRSYGAKKKLQSTPIKILISNRVKLTWNCAYDDRLTPETVESFSIDDFPKQFLNVRKISWRETEIRYLMSTLEKL